MKIKIVNPHFKYACKVYNELKGTVLQKQTHIHDIIQTYCNVL